MTSAVREWVRGRLRGALLAAALLAAGAALPGCGGPPREVAPPPPAPGEPAPPEPPALDLAGADPAVVRAVEAARAAVAESPQSAAAWGRLGMILLTHGLPVEASNACFAEAERLDAKEPRWPYFQGRVLLATDPEAGVGKLRRAAELCGDAPEAPRLRLAEALLEQGRHDEAAEQFRAVLRQHPDSARAHLGLGRLAYHRDDLRASLDHLERAAADVSARKAARVLMAEVHQRLGHKAAARELLDRVAHLPDDPAWPDPFLEEAARLRTGKQSGLARADELIREGQAAEALDLARGLVRDYPDSEWAWVMLGRALLLRNDAPAAEEALRRAVGLAPDSAEPHFYLGVALFGRKKYAEAAGCFRKAGQLKPDFALAHYNLGHCLKEEGDAVGAIAAFRAAVSRKPDYAPAHTNLGELLARGGQYAEAVSHLRQAVQLNPADPHARALLDEALARGAGSKAP